MKYSVDSIDDKTAVLAGDDQSRLAISRADLPGGIYEGDIVDINDGIIAVDRGETKRRRTENNRRLKRLFEDQNKKTRFINTTDKKEQASDMSKTIKSSSSEQTEQIACELAEKLHPGDVIALFGEMGAGKTAFVRGLARGMGLDDRVSSPTFAIVHDYSGRLIHFDMYRIESWDSLYSTGYYDYLDSNAVIVIEWSENVENALPEGYIRVDIEKTENENERIITIDGLSLSEG